MERRLLCCSGSLEGGGSERQLWMLARGVDPVRFQPQIYLLYRRGIYLGRLPSRIPVHAFWSEHSVTEFRWPGQIHRRQVQHLQQLLKRQQIDIVYDRTYHMTLVTAAACRAARTPRVSVMINPPSLDFMQQPERFRWIKKRLLRIAYRDPRCRLVAVSNAAADDAARFFALDRQRILTIPSPVDLAGVQQSSRETTPAAPLPPGQPGTAVLRIVVVGRLSKQKNQRLALEACSRLKSLRSDQEFVLRFVGEGPDHADLQRQAEDLGIRNCVRFEGFLENPFPLIRESDLLCLPSNFEGLPNVVLEAMCLQTPVLATDCNGALRELIGECERGVLVPVGDADRLAAEMLDRLDHPDLWRDRAQAAYQWVARHHGLSQWIDRMQSLFEQVLRQ